MGPMPPSVADVMVGTLAKSGVERVYGLPGDSLNGFTDALRRSGEPVWEHVRHEEAAAFAAGAEAQLTGRLAVCAGSCGPGNLHLINGLYDAQRSGAPVLAIAAHIPREEIGLGYFQETHPERLFTECSVFCEMVSIPEQLPRLLEVAMQTALSRQGVAVLVVPGEVFLADAPRGSASREIIAAPPARLPAEEQVRAAAAALEQADRVTILAGAGCRGARDKVIALADVLRAPVVHTLRSKEHVEADNPFDVGLTGLLGFSSGYRAMEHCDALLMLGTDFPYRDFYPDNATVVQVDVRGERIGRRTAVAHGLVGEVGPTADALLAQLDGGRRGSEHLELMTGHYRRARGRMEGLAKPAKEGRPLRPQHVAATLDRLAADDAIFTADVGTPVVWAARYLRMNGRRRLIGSFVHGSMANALPQAVGAQASHPGRQVIAMSGDGGLAMLLGELLTVRQTGHPVKVVVFDNDALSFVELEMKAAGIVNFGTGLDNPDFAEVARAIGLHGVSVESSEQLEAGLREALDHEGPALVNVRTERQQLSLPPHVTATQVKGFALYTARSILTGRGDELVSLARANLRDLASE